MKKFLLIIALIALIKAPFAIAGGGPVAIYGFSLKPFDQTKTYIVQVEVYANQSCNQIKPAVSFEDQVDGDNISPFTPPDDGTYITRHYQTDGPNRTWKEICNTYFQVKSGDPKQRIIKASVTTDGRTHERETTLAFGDDYISKQIQSFGRVNDYDNKPWPDVISEKYLGFSKGAATREVQLHWQKISWAAKYVIFSREVGKDGKLDELRIVLTGTDSTQTAVIVPAFSTLRLEVMGCGASDPCTIAKEENINWVYLDKMRNVENSRNNNSEEPKTKTRQTKSIIPTKIEQEVNDDKTTSVIQPTSPDQKTIDELNKKVASLEGKLNQSQEKQNVLEQRVNDLMNFIKRLFPFFR